MDILAMHFTYRSTDIIKATEAGTLLSHQGLCKLVVEISALVILIRNSFSAVNGEAADVPSETLLIA